ncbi:MAG: isoaspartyl peptidase/L-asparaginase family protein [Candidatus Baldrarchaeota archaeon]
MEKFIIVVHGGAGRIRPEFKDRALRGVKKAAKAGYDILSKGGTALDAVEEAVKVMEDDPTFNAGTGSTLTIDGRIEMDASIMDGKTLNAGSVAMIRNIRHPVTLARIIMEKTDHVFIAGDFAEKLAETFNLERCNPITENRIKIWKEYKTMLIRGEHQYLPKTTKLIKIIPELATDTVGAVARDKDGNLAAATSTGGLTLKLPGRIGDTPLIGCGNYADNEAGAASATGIGEVAIRLVLAKTVCDFMRNGLIAQKAVEKGIEVVKTRQNNLPMGIIAVDKYGNPGIAHNSESLSWAIMASDSPKVVAGLKYPP